MRRQLARIVLMAVLISTPAVAAPAAAGGSVEFAIGISDLPLMAGLTQKTDRGYVFDKPGGRIVEVIAGGPVSVGAARDFYAAVLPEFGWRQAGAAAVKGPPTQLYFERDGERLRLAITGGQAAVTLRFTLTPKP